MACVAYSFCAREGGSIFIPVAFADRTGAAVIPNTITWRLTDANGTVINSRSAVSVTPAASVDILLEGDDLPFNGANNTDSYDLFLLITAVYDEDDVSDVTQTQEATISVKNNKGA